MVTVKSTYIQKAVSEIIFWDGEFVFTWFEILGERTGVAACEILLIR